MSQDTFIDEIQEKLQASGRSYMVITAGKEGSGLLLGGSGQDLLEAIFNQMVEVEQFSALLTEAAVLHSLKSLSDSANEVGEAIKDLDEALAKDKAVH